MAPNINTMRQIVSELYEAPKWKNRVARMRDDQIIAIYFRTIEEKPKKEEPEDDGQQTLF